MNLYEPYPPELTWKQWLKGQRHDGTFDYAAEKKRQVLMFLFSLSLFTAIATNQHLYLQCTLAGLIVGLALKSFVARRWKDQP